jgi:hypothetical protein
LIASLVKLAARSHIRRVHHKSIEFQEEIVTKNPVLADVVTKTVYFTLIAAVFVFVSMLLLTGLHS